MIQVSLWSTQNIDLILIHEEVRIVEVIVQIMNYCIHVSWRGQISEVVIQVLNWLPSRKLDSELNSSPAKLIYQTKKKSTKVISNKTVLSFQSALKVFGSLWGMRYKFIFLIMMICHDVLMYFKKKNQIVVKVFYWSFGGQICHVILLILLLRKHLASASTLFKGVLLC